MSEKIGKSEKDEAVFKIPEMIETEEGALEANIMTEKEMKALEKAVGGFEEGKSRKIGGFMMSLVQNNHESQDEMDKKLNKAQEKRVQSFGKFVMSRLAEIDKAA